MFDKLRLEQEGTPEQPQTDAIWVLNGRGVMVKVEVDDDVEDDKT